MENIYKIAIPLIKKFEGLVLHPYYCSASKLTIGYGERIDLRPDKLYNGILGNQITHQCGLILAKHRGNITKANAEIAKKYPNLTTEKESTESLYEVLKNDFWGEFSKELPHGLTDTQCAVIISFAYNVGVANLRSSTFFKLIQSNQFEKAGKELLKWVFAGGKKLKGLEYRRKEETELFLNG